MISRNRKRIIEKIVESCIKQKDIHKELLYIALLGSTKTQESVEGYSDIDILFIFKSSNSGEIKEKILLELKNISERLSRNSNIEISLLPHTIFDFEEYVDFNYLIHYSWGKVLYGDVRKFERLFNKIISKKYSERNRLDLIYYNLVHARFNLIRKFVSWNKNNKSNYNKDILKLVIDSIIEICDWALVFDGIFKKNKKEIIEHFNKRFEITKYKHIPQTAYKIRSEWTTRKLSSEESEKFIRESMLFVQELIDFFHKKHAKN